MQRSVLLQIYLIKLTCPYVNYSIHYCWIDSWLRDIALSSLLEEEQSALHKFFWVSSDEYLIIVWHCNSMGQERKKMKKHNLQLLDLSDGVLFNIINKLSQADLLILYTVSSKLRRRIASIDRLMIRLYEIYFNQQEAVSLLFDPWR